MSNIKYVMFCSLSGHERIKSIFVRKYLYYMANLKFRTSTKDGRMSSCKVCVIWISAKPRIVMHIVYSTYILRIHKLTLYFIP